MSREMRAVLTAATMLLLVSTPVAAQRGPSTTAAAVGEAGQAARVNDWTVGVAGGLLEGTFVRFAAEMAKALDDGENLRILPIITYGASENVNDLLYLKGIDIAITHSDVFDEFKRTRKAANIEQRVNYITRMYISEFHVWARPEIKTMKDLEGKKVGFHTRGAGSSITAPIVFERLGIKVEPVYINNTIAWEKMKTGEIAALINNAGKPNNLFTNMKAEPDFHFLSIPFSDKFEDFYVPAVLTNQDYPNLIPQGQTIETLGIPVILAVYNWPEGGDRYRRVRRFIEYFVNHFDRLKEPSFHPKWKDINLAATVPGWTRFPPAQEMLNKVAARTQATHDPAAQQQSVESSKPTHVSTGPLQIFKEAGGKGTIVQQLPPFTTVTLVKSQQGWVLIAKDGTLLGYVAESKLRKLN
jgi:TRAP transporter TAXI family solute receptor